MRTTILLAGLTFATSAFGAALPTATPEAVGMSSERLARIAPVIQSYIDKGLIAGAVTAVARKGRLVHWQTHGQMDVLAGKPMRDDAIFRIASMTKPITSVALMMLWEQGGFQLRDPVSKFLPEFADPKVSTTRDASAATGELVAVDRPIQVRDMLTHTAGLANNYIGNAVHYRAFMSQRDGLDLAGYIQRLASLPLNYQPGTAWEYSAATDVVGRLVEVISGMTLDAYLKERIFDPLGMPDSHFFMDDDKGGRLAAQYTPGEDDFKIVLQDPGSNESRWINGPKILYRGAGGMVSTTHDYLRFQQMVLNGGELEGVRLLAPATVALMIENHTGDLPLWLPGPGMGFGLGYGIVVDRGAAATPLSEGSAYWGGAYCTISWIDPAQQIVGVLMTQVRPYTHLNVRQDFQVLVHQAIVE